jgi:hypothetical protein
VSLRNIDPVKYGSDEGFVEHKIELGDEDLEEIIREYLERHADFDFDEVEVVNKRDFLEAKSFSESLPCHEPRETLNAAPKATSDAGLLAYRELDDALNLSTPAAAELQDKRTGQNSRHSLTAPGHDPWEQDGAKSVGFVHFALDRAGAGLSNGRSGGPDEVPRPRTPASSGKSKMDLGTRRTRAKPSAQ